jgi:anti-anti-sigma regulatory factor
MANRTRPKSRKPTAGKQPAAKQSPARRAVRAASAPKAARPESALEPVPVAVELLAPQPVASEFVAPASGGSCLRLGASLSIHEAADCQLQLRSALAAGLTEIDVAALETIDTAGVQLLLVTARAAHAQGGRLCFSHAHKLLSGAADALGLRAAFSAVAELSA